MLCASTPYIIIFSYKIITTSTYDFTIKYLYIQGYCNRFRKNNNKKQYKNSFKIKAVYKHYLFSL